MKNLLQATKDLGTFTYNVLGKIYNNPKIMGERNLRNSFIDLLGNVWVDNWIEISREYTPKQEKIMNKFLDNERLYGCKEFFEYSGAYELYRIIGDTMGEYSQEKTPERVDLSDEILQKLLDNKNINQKQLAQILKIMSSNSWKDNKDMEMAKLIVDDEALRKEVLAEDKWHILKAFTGNEYDEYDLDDVIKFFGEDEKLKDNKPFQDLANRMYEEAKTTRKQGRKK